MQKAKASVPSAPPIIVMRPLSRKPVNVDSIEAMTPETDRLVTGTFSNLEYPGQPAKVCAALYKGMQYFCKTFLDGEKCQIPLSVARFINERCSYEQHDYLQDEKGNPVKTVKRIPRYKFISETF